MSALAVIRDLLARKARWFTACLICDEGKPEVQVLCTNLEFFLCKDCTRKNLDALLDNDYILYGGDAARRRAEDLVLKKMG